LIDQLKLLQLVAGLIRHLPIAKDFY